MSTFSGITREYPEVAIDYFSGKQILKSRAYFLSHVHTDHMVGLHSSTFANHLETHPSYKLYCSEVTREFLLTSSKHRHLKKSLVALPIEQQCDVLIPNDITGEKETLQVTLLPAGHCPGSVMFLLEGAAGNVLYTGDFRFKIGDAANMETLHEGTGVKPLKSLYIDTTFFDPEIKFIPNREQSCEAMLRLIGEQLQQGPRHMVHMKCKAKYGYEFLFMEISRVFGMKVHVSDDIMKQYERVPELAEHMTTDGSTTQVHACRKYACTLEDAVDVITILPSTMWFNSNAQSDDVLKKISSHYYRLCFSFHSSYSEICDFIRYLRPSNIYPNVIPYRSTEYQMIERLQNVLRNIPDVDSKSEDKGYKPLGRLMLRKKRTRKRGQCKEAVHNKSLDVLFGDGSPPAKNKKIDNPLKNDDVEDDQAKHKPEAGEKQVTPGTAEVGEGPFIDAEHYASSDDGAGTYTEEDGGTSDSLFSEDGDEKREIEDEESQDRDRDCEYLKENSQNQSSILSENSQSQSSPFKSFVKYLPSGKARTSKSDEAALSGIDNCCKMSFSQSLANDATHLITKSERIAPPCEQIAPSCEKVSPKFATVETKNEYAHVVDPLNAKDDTGIPEQKCKKHSKGESPQSILPTTIDSLLQPTNYATMQEERNLKDDDIVNPTCKREKMKELNLLHNKGTLIPEDINNSLTAPLNGQRKESNSLGSCSNLSESSSQDSVSPCKSFLQYLPRKSPVEDVCETSATLIERGPSVEAECSEESPEEMKKIRKCLANEKMVTRDDDTDDDDDCSFITSPESNSPVFVKTKTNTISRFVDGNSVTKLIMEGKSTGEVSTCEQSSDNRSSICGCAVGREKTKKDTFSRKCSCKQDMRDLEKSELEIVQFDVNVNHKSENETSKGNKRSPNSYVHTGNSNFGKPIISQINSTLNFSGEKDARQIKKKEVLFIDLTEPDEKETTSSEEDEAVILDFQGSETTAVMSPSVKSSQETYLSPSKLLMENSQDVFILSSPENSDSSSDCIELL